MEKYLYPVTGEKNKEIRALLQNNRQALVDADTTTPVKENGLCYDGIIDEAVFSELDYRVIFLLKETNGNNPDGSLPETLQDWDYRAWLENQQVHAQPSNDSRNSVSFYAKTYNKLSMWLDQAIYSLQAEIPTFERYEKECYNESHFRNTLRKTAIINLKKTWGGGSTEWRHLDSYLSHAITRQVLRGELTIIKPDLVICGGSGVVFDFAKDIFCTHEQALILPNKETLRYFSWGRAIFIDFYHPTCRGSIKRCYEYAATRFTEIAHIVKLNKNSC